MKSPLLIIHSNGSAPNIAHLPPSIENMIKTFHTRNGYTIGRSFKEYKTHFLNLGGKRVVEEIEAKLSKAKGKLILDIGCGRGRALNEIKSKYKGVRVMGITYPLSQHSPLNSSEIIFGDFFEVAKTIANLNAYLAFDVFGVFWHNPSRLKKYLALLPSLLEKNATL